jgi:threonine dehydratase
MSRSSPAVKQQAVRHHGGEWIAICLPGDSYDEVVLVAREEEAASGAFYVHAADDLLVVQTGSNTDFQPLGSSPRAREREERRRAPCASASPR